MITNVTLIKEDNRISEQNFGVTLSFGDPGSTRPATLQSLEDLNAPFDYNLGVPGLSSISREFGPDQTEISNLVFFLFSDELPEGTEGFLINIASVGDIFPNFQLPTDTTAETIPAFASTLVTILDNDCMFINFAFCSTHIPYNYDCNNSCCCWL